MATENKHVGDALVNLDAAATENATAARREAENVMRRDRRRIATLTCLAILFGILAAAAFFMQFLVFYWTVPRVACGVYHHIKLDHKVDPSRIAGDHILQESETYRQEWNLLSSNTFIQWMGITSAAGLALAVCATVILVRASRRAALRQVNASLLEISSQLKELQKTMKHPGDRLP
jgi:hypothetical protein